MTEPEDSWEAHMRAGIASLSEGRPDKAAEQLGRAQLMRPGHLPTLQALACAHLKSGEAADALGAFDRVLATRPGDPAALHGRGLALNALGDRFGALATFRQLAGLDPDAWKAWQSIADITADEEERIAAIDQAADILNSLCARPAPPTGLIRKCAAALVHARRFEEAAIFIQENTSRFSNAAEAHSQLADVHYQSGAFRTAFAHKLRALSLMRREDLPPVMRPNGFDPGAAIDALLDLGGILRARGIRFFLIAGTLLGFVRNGAPLRHDRDIDIGILRQKDGKPDIAELIRTHPALYLRHDARPGDRYFALFHKGVGIDVFLHDETGSAILCGVGDHPGDIQWRFSHFTLAEADNQGAGWLMPNDPERYLCETYGPDWRRPDTGFASAISSPALFGVDPYARAYYSVSRARKALLRGDRDKARALLNQSPVPIVPHDLLAGA